MFLASAIRSAGFSPLLRQRMSPELLVDEPFRQLARAAELIREHAESSEPDAHAQLLRDAQYLRALLDVCRRCAASVHEHLEAHGVSVDVVFEADQLRERTHRIELLLGCVLSEQPAKELLRFVAELVDAAEGRRSIRGLFAEHYSMLARKVAERSADAGDHYITRDAAEYREMLRAAAGGGAVLGATTLLKALIGIVGLGVFWAGFVNGLNYAASFVADPAAALHGRDQAAGDDRAGARRQARRRRQRRRARALRRRGRAPDPLAGRRHLRQPARRRPGRARRAVAGAGGVRRADRSVRRRPSTRSASLSLAGPTPIFAALTGVLLFASSLIAGWVENWFVWHRLDSAIAWNPRIVDRFGAARARWWSAFWRRNISGLASNVSLGLLLGLVPAIASFFSLPIDVRHVTLATGQLAAAVGALGLGIVASAPFWWCVAGIAAIGTLNLGVSFWLAFRVAVRSRGIRLADQSRIRRAVAKRLRQRPASFILPPRLATT